MFDQNWLKICIKKHNFVILLGYYKINILSLSLSLSLSPSLSLSFFDEIRQNLLNHFCLNFQFRLLKFNNFYLHM